MGDKLKGDNNEYKKISIGYGNKYSFKTGKEDEETPGPIYSTEYLRSIQQRVDKIENRRWSTFGCDKDQQAKVMYPGQERHYYGSHSPGPGVYNVDDSVQPLSSIRNGSKYSMPKGDRGLLTLKKDIKPNPFTYENAVEVYKRVLAKREGAFSMPRSERSFNFAKYASNHSVLVQKGLY